ncbi:hypothetical protein F5141DRAFT_450654 [Pisolithus sp. B1]|nr:hypothetical protein F5141DRAFT_450654 [Pisolithus sp. B1]
MSSSPVSSPHLRYVAWWCLPCFAGTHSFIFDYFLAYLRWKFFTGSQSRTRRNDLNSQAAHSNPRVNSCSPS